MKSFIQYFQRGRNDASPNRCLTIGVLQVLLWVLAAPPEVLSFPVTPCVPNTHSQHNPTRPGVRLHQSSLVPEENPYADASVASLSGVRYSDVLSGLDRLFPPTDLDSRNALSRTDGYWPYIQNGKDPPLQLTYGEFDFYFFASLLDKAHSLFYQDSDRPVPSDWSGMTFVDVGSGTGRLVLAAAALHPSFRECRGVELLPGIHEKALATLADCPVDDEGRAQLRTMSREESGPLHTIPMAPVSFACGSFESPYVYIGDADIVFVFSSCMGHGLLDGLAQSIGRSCKPGTLVITTDYMLPLEADIAAVEDDDRVPSGRYRLELVETVEGWCWLTGGASTAYIHRVKESLWREDQGPLAERELSLEDRAFRVARAMEKGELGDPQAFARGIHNNMVFHGIPERFYPRLDT
ncbi:predicted protein [Phaeodactylum tricornutum CCAP 1055/1]|jgi:SAM-dependent methyltransferase|uniref:Histone-lysine N-methyltransferase, H3 lysine-79 specific n=1 Tax=Phaeodactylum tricornutum (strain CCAP 1055/1) TaxID=556484 RepID=B7FVI9_PHATC|nr:predicted protein [Phaeodactylum tricornutum CCAP 1055/1]EEC49637.1 predicted protein [Phaeodactylum tricornutum CCAP 1055/1]|eukprot:XP_002178939.1 predicted protein [Phaeodactylum tricornutum CCAP 1055/1]